MTINQTVLKTKTYLSSQWPISETRCKDVLLWPKRGESVVVNLTEVQVIAEAILISIYGDLNNLQKMMTYIVCSLLYDEILACTEPKKKKWIAPSSLCLKLRVSAYIPLFVYICICIIWRYIYIYACPKWKNFDS